MAAKHIVIFLDLSYFFFFFWFGFFFFFNSVKLFYLKAIVGEKTDRRMMPKGHRAKKAPMDETIVELESPLEIIRGLIISFPR